LVKQAEQGTHCRIAPFCLSHYGRWAALAGRRSMLWTIAIILFVLWLLGFFAFHVAGGLIHILLVIAVIVLIWQLVAGRRGV